MERERAFRVGSEWQGGLTPRERWKAFQSCVERGLEKRKGRWVRRIAVANWMDRKDMEW